MALALAGSLEKGCLLGVKYAAIKSGTLPNYIIPHYVTGILTSSPGFPAFLLCSHQKSWEAWGRCYWSTTCMYTCQVKGQGANSS